MKKITLFLLLSMVIVFSAEAHKYKNKNTHITISVQTFYDQLSPYGDWIYSPDYGYVWRPYFDNPESFRPYSSNGNWVYTDYGWTWASDYNWGWATFHYGRWDFDDYLGWMWIPGYEWAPAWVTWGSYDNYWGWAPMGPNIYVQHSSNWFAPDPWWTFVPRQRFCSNDWNHYIYNRPVHVTNITHITNVYVNSNNNNSWYNGPRVNEVERYNVGKVRRVVVTESQRPENAGLRNDRLSVYRPAVDNKRGESRPTEYRNVENARSDRRIVQNNARTNDPGINRTRENKSEARSSNQMPSQRNGAVNRESQVSPRTSTQVSDSRPSGVKREVKETVRTATQTQRNAGSVNREARTTTGNGTQVSAGRNTTRPSVETKRDTPNRESNVKATERTPSNSRPARVEKNENSQPRNNAPVRVNENSNSGRETGNRQNPATRPTSDQRTQSAAPASNQRTGNTERKQVVKEEVKQAGSRKSTESQNDKTSGKPTRR